MFVSLMMSAALACTPAPGGAPASRMVEDSTNVRGLPVLELRPTRPAAHTLVIFLSGDGGWADLDEKIGQRLQSRGVFVIGFDMRDYLRGGKRTPASTAYDVSRVARRYMALWQLDSIAIVGYSRGADVAPFVANRMSSDVRPRLSLIGMLTLLERASFVYHFSDLWRMTSGSGDTPITPELQQLAQTKMRMLCIYGKDEKESLCRTAPAGLMTVIQRDGKHHFDGNYDAIADILYQALVPSPKTPARS